MIAPLALGPTISNNLVFKKRALFHISYINKDYARSIDAMNADKKQIADKSMTMQQMTKKNPWDEMEDTKLSAVISVIGP